MFREWYANCTLKDSFIIPENKQKVNSYIVLQNSPYFEEKKKIDTDLHLSGEIL